MTKRFWLIVLLALGMASFAPASGEVHAQFRTQNKLDLSCPALPMVTKGLLRSHVSSTKEDDAFVKNVAALYAERIDPTEVLLTESEFQKLERRLVRLVKSVGEGDCSDLTKLKKDQIEWQEEMEEYVRKIAKDVKIDKNREFDLDPDKRDRPRNAREQSELRRAIVEFQLANYLASGIDEKDARKKLVHRYELRTKRVRELKTEEVYDVFLDAYAGALDPHSTYFSPEEVEDFKIRMELSLTGIGAVLSYRDGFTVVEEIVPGGAADEHGKLKPKDQIVAVAQGDEGEPVNVIDMELRDVVEMIRGEKDTKVRLTVLRKGDDKTERRVFTITRAKIDLKQQAAKLHWRDVKRGKKKVKVAIIELPSFYMGDSPGARNSARDVAKLVEKAKKGNADGIVLDLSRNGGGALQSAVDISGLFIEEGSIVGVGGTNADDPRVLEDEDPKLRWDGPLVVLTSKISASASEILAGALQDYRRAVVVGDSHTFGKGSVQQLRKLPPGLGLLKVTTDLFYLPGGDSTQSTGVEADIIVPSPFAALEIGEKHQPHALDPATTKDFRSSAANKSKKWKPVPKGVVAKLRKKSEKRIASHPEFAELRKKLSESDPDDTKVKLAEILENGSGGDDDAEEDDEETLSIQVKEAAEILADLVARK